MYNIVFNLSEKKSLANRPKEPQVRINDPQEDKALDR